MVWSEHCVHFRIIENSFAVGIPVCTVFYHMKDVIDCKVTSTCFPLT